MKPTQILHFRIMPKIRLKVEIYGNVRPEVVEEIKDTIHYLPEDFKSAFRAVSVLRIYRKSSRSPKDAFFDPLDYSINVFDKPNSYYPSEYSQIFLHEFGHVIFDILSDLSSLLDKEVGEQERAKETQKDQDARNPFWAFINEVNSKKIKPISQYSKQHFKRIKSTKTDAKEFEALVVYSNEVFAECFSFTYCRYTNDEDVIGTFCNYIALRNAFWRLVDGFDIGNNTQFL
jgi:hypothetical protein